MTHTVKDGAHQGRWVKVGAIVAGVGILAAATAKVIVAGNQDKAAAALSIAIAFGVFVGSMAIGRAIQSKRWVVVAGIAIALTAGELYGFITTADRIVGEREAVQAEVKKAMGAHQYALDAMTKAQNAYDAALAKATTARAKAIEDARIAKANAQKAVTESAALPGCKDRCKALLDAAVASAQTDVDTANKAPMPEDTVAVVEAKQELENARSVHRSNPKPTASGTPLADRLGVPAWLIDLTVAGLLSLAANGLAATLIAFGAHRGNPVATEPAKKADEDAATDGNHQTVAEDPQPPKGRPMVAINPVATKAAAEADIIRLIARGQDIPEQQVLATRWNVHKGTASKWINDFERRGLIKREQVGKAKRVAAG